MKLYVVLLGGLLACGSHDNLGRLPDAPPLSPPDAAPDASPDAPDARPAAHLIIEPPDVAVTVVNDAVVTQAYTARLVDEQGTSIDVTPETTFALHDPAYGSFSGATLFVTGQGAGPVRVEATARGQTGDTGLTVMVKKTIVDPGGPAELDPPALFAAAQEDPARAPAIAYPLDQILVPPNLGQFDVHWRNNAAGGASNNLFEITLANPYVDVRLYTTGLDPRNPQPFWTVFQPQTWYPIASSRQQLTLTVAGLDTAQPATKGSAAAQRVDVTNENAQGGIYYWTTSGLAGIWRYDVSKPEVPPAPYFADTARPAGCMGCHTLSRDGTRMAMTFDGGGGRATIFDVATRSALIPFDVTPLRWDFATFDAHATRLVTVESNQLFLRALDGSQLAGPLPPVTAGFGATHPELSPDDKQLVSVEFSGGYDAQAYTGSIVIRSFDAASNTFGAPTTLVPYAQGAANYYPSFSPDGQWVVFTRTSNYSYNDGSAETWLVKADGSQPPVQLATANLTGNLTNSWARWVPFAQTFGARNEPLFYLTFSSQRPFGVRIPGGGRPQIWMTPVFPARAAAGNDPSGNAFRVPFQDVSTANHIAQWTQAVVVDQPPAVRRR